jgi:hypothetical protein
VPGLRWVIFDRDEASSRSRHVGYAPESGSKIRVSASAAMGPCWPIASPKNANLDARPFVETVLLGRVSREGRVQMMELATKIYTK